MRHIGTLKDAQEASRFEDYLLARGISSRVDCSDEDHEIWVFDEDQVDTAKDELTSFLADPEKAIYREAASAASALRKEKEKRQRADRKRQVDVRSHWEKPFPQRSPVTFALIVISAVVAITTTSDSLWNLCNDQDSYLRQLFIVAPFTPIGPDSYNGLKETISSGQLWRLITPIFIHASFIHILFNMLWLRDLGSAIEYRKGSVRLLLMVLLIAVVSNIAQCVITGPNFRGMSGVVFGLFGYIWMKGRFDPSSGLGMPPSTTFLMLLFFFLCFTGALGPIANWCHAFGLLTGIALGIMSSPARR